jgi:hypothetical protein
MLSPNVSQIMPRVGWTARAIREGKYCLGSQDGSRRSRDQWKGRKGAQVSTYAVVADWVEAFIKVVEADGALRFVSIGWKRSRSVELHTWGLSSLILVVLQRLFSVWIGRRMVKERTATEKRTW